MLVKTLYLLNVLCQYSPIYLYNSSNPLPPWGRGLAVLLYKIESYLYSSAAPKELAAAQGTGLFPGAAAICSYILAVCLSCTLLKVAYHSLGIELSTVYCTET